MTDTTKAREIWARINEIAPYPDCRAEATAEAVARYLAARAQMTFAAGLIPFAEGPTREDMARMAAEFAAAHALDALRRIDPDFAAVAAREIWSAWDSGEGIGEYLWKQLGDTTANEVSGLADDLAAAMTGPDAEVAAAHVPLPTSGPLTAAEADRFRSAAATLGRTIDRMARSMEAARIEMLQNGPAKAMQWILNSLPDVDDNDPSDQWDGKESAAEWLDRTAGAEAPGE